MIDIGFLFPANHVTGFSIGSSTGAAFWRRSVFPERDGN
jgi:hypothetical protein